jgi:hypothetical protein
MSHVIVYCVYIIYRIYTDWTFVVQSYLSIRMVLKVQYSGQNKYVNSLEIEKEKYYNAINGGAIF